MTPAELDDIASYLAGCRKALAPVGLPDWASSLDLSGAYAVQDRVADREAAAGNPPVGYKIGCTTHQGQAALGLASPIYARVFSHGRKADGGIVKQRGLYRLGVECEIAAILGRVDHADTADLPVISHIAIACEIVEDRYGGLSGAGAACLIADNFANRGFVLGPLLAFDEFGASGLDNLSSRITTSTGILSDGKVEAGMVPPLQTLQWLAKTVRVSDSELRPGDVVLTGAIGRPLWLDEPTDVALSVNGIGSLSLAIR